MEPTPAANLLRPGQRTLAAIVFTDVVSFSARMQADEERTLRLLRRDFDHMRDCAARHEGSVLKTTGDGLLLYFTSAVQAVGCALSMQRYFADHARKLPAEDVLVHRVGIHLGDVFVSDQDVMGDGVNIAARLQAEAEPGGICISQTVYDVVKNKLTLHVTSLGARELKNISESIPIYQLLLEAESIRNGSTRPFARPAPAPVAAPTPSTPVEPKAPSPLVTALGSKQVRRGAAIAAVLVLLVAAGWQIRARRLASREAAQREAARTAVQQHLDEIGRTEAGMQERLRHELALLRNAPQLRNEYLDRYDFAGLAQWLRRRNANADTETPALLTAAQRLALLRQWLVQELQRYDAQRPFVTPELSGAAPKDLRVYAGEDRQIYFAEGGAVRGRPLPAIRPPVLGALIAGTIAASTTPPPREVLAGAVLFARLYQLPELTNALRARPPRQP